MSIEEARGLLILSILPLILAEIAVVLLAWVACRFRFSEYVKTHHPQKWSELFPESDAARRVSLTLDLSPALREFRLGSSDDLGDAELSAHRKSANRLERMAIVGFVALAAWVVTVIGVIAVLT